MAADRKTTESTEAELNAKPLRVSNRLATVVDPKRAADLFSRILLAVRAERDAQEEKCNADRNQ